MGIKSTMATSEMPTPSSKLGVMPKAFIAVPDKLNPITNPIQGLAPNTDRAVPSDSFERALNFLKLPSKNWRVRAGFLRIASTGCKELSDIDSLHPHLRLLDPPALRIAPLDNAQDYS